MKCPNCGGETKGYTKYPDEYGNPTDGSFWLYCTKCDWDEQDYEANETK